MKIRVVIMAPHPPLKDFITAAGFTVWNLENVDEFAERFIKNDSLIIDEFVTSIYNFEKYSPHIATFDTVEPVQCVCISARFALQAVDSPNHKGAYHNIKIDFIDDDQNPLWNSDTYYNGFEELAEVASVSNIEFFGEPPQPHRFDAEQKKNLINMLGVSLRKMVKTLRMSNDSDSVRKRIFQVILEKIEDSTDDYADLKEELRILDVDVLSDIFLYDAYYNKKYRGYF